MGPIECLKELVTPDTDIKVRVQLGIQLGDLLRAKTVCGELGL